MPRPDTFQFDAIGTRWWIEPIDSTLNDPIKRKLLAVARDFDHDYSRFIDGSIIDRLNRGQVVHRPPDDLLELFRLSKEFFDVSRGVFNVSVGGVLHERGYGARSKAAPVYPDPWPYVVYDHRSARLEHTMTIDFGGLGKGWLIDRFSDILRSYDVQKFIVNGGGDVYVSSDSPVEIALENAEGTKTIGSTKLRNQALAVSSNTKRRWVHYGQEYAHLVHPTEHTSDVRAAYVKADSAVVADAMATVLYLQPELTAELSSRYGLTVRLVRD